MAGYFFAARIGQAFLRDALFEPEQWLRALHAPPLKSRWSLTGNSWERLGARFFPGLSGVHIAEARKSLYAPGGTNACTGGSARAGLRLDRRRGPE